MATRMQLSLRASTCGCQRAARQYTETCAPAPGRALNPAGRRDAEELRGLGSPAGTRPKKRRLLPTSIRRTQQRGLPQEPCNANMVATAKPTTPTCIVLPSNAHNVRAGNSL